MSKELNLTTFNMRKDEEGRRRDHRVRYLSKQHGFEQRLKNRKIIFLLIKLIIFEAMNAKEWKKIIIVVLEHNNKPRYNILIIENSFVNIIKPMCENTSQTYLSNCR